MPDCVRTARPSSPPRGILDEIVQLERGARRIRSRMTAQPRGVHVLSMLRATDDSRLTIVVRVIGGVPLFAIGLVHAFGTSAPMQPIVEAMGAAVRSGAGAARGGSRDRGGCLDPARAVGACWGAAHGRSDGGGVRRAPRYPGVACGEQPAAVRLAAGHPRLRRVRRVAWRRTVEPRRAHVASKLPSTTKRPGSSPGRCRVYERSRCARPAGHSGRSRC